MKLSKLAAIAIAVLLVTAGAAVAAPGNAPDNAGEADDAPDPGDDDRGDDLAENASDDTDRDANSSAADDRPGDRDENAAASDGDASAANAQGPAEDLPAHVPSHVAEIHDLIRQFIANDLDGNLGEAVSSVTANDDAAADNAPASE